jgi:hypothetical protein
MDHENPDPVQHAALMAWWLQAFQASEHEATTLRRSLSPSELPLGGAGGPTPGHMALVVTFAQAHADR